MQIVFATEGLEFDGDALKTRSLGGSETAMISMACELAKLGNDVRVYCNTNSPGVYDGVQYHKCQMFTQHNLYNEIDVLIASRWAEYLTTPVRAGLRVFWAHDIVPADDYQRMIPWVQNMFQTDMILLLSNYHVENYLKGMPEGIKSRAQVTKNGVDLELVDRNLSPKIPGKLIYTSRPERGLLNLLKFVMPTLLDTHPHAKLHVCSYDLSSLPTPTTGPLPGIYKECAQLINRLPNVVSLGSLRKEELYREMSSSELVVYPVNFPESFCITAIEAQACGTPMITSDAFALKETLGDGCGSKIPFGKSNDEYLGAFCDEVIRWLDDGELRSLASANGRKFVETNGYTWSAIAKSWQNLFMSYLEKRLSTNIESVYKELVREQNTLAAAKLAEKTGITSVDGDDVVSYHPIPKEIPNEEIAVGFRNALTGRYTQGLELVRLVGEKMPSRILEYRAGSISAGLAYAKWIDKCEVHVIADTSLIAEQLNKHKDVMGLTNFTVHTSEDTIEGKFDLLLLDEVVDDEHEPSRFVNSVMSKYVESGKVLMFNRFGTDSVKWNSPTRELRTWSFSLSDLSDMFGECADYATTVSTQKENALGEPIGHFVTIFSKSGPVNRLSLKKKYLRTRPYQSLGVCMIASNEEDWIRGALKSVQGIADECQVLLNGSSDKTKDICEDLGVLVKQSDFDNFSQVRNESKEGLNTDWVLWVDADERLVNSFALKKYLHTSIFEGFAIKQNHLMLDMEKSFDLPIRVFKNREHYRFTGYIHEHCENVSRNPFDDSIEPTLVLQDVDIAHYGYINEKVRRYKCSARNLRLLIRDVEDNGKQRMLTWVLVLRDYLNIVKWSFESHNSAKVEQGSFEHGCLMAAVSTFVNHLEKTGHRYEQLGRPMYQEALSILGANGLPSGNGNEAPFQIGMCLFGAVGGLEDKNVAPDSIWFRSLDEYMEFANFQVASLAKKIGLPAEPPFPYPKAKHVEPQHSVLLAEGLDVVGSPV